jgi:hypothetical protein
MRRVPQAAVADGGADAAARRARLLVRPPAPKPRLLLLVGVEDAGDGAASQGCPSSLLADAAVVEAVEVVLAASVLPPALWSNQAPTWSGSPSADRP